MSRRTLEPGVAAVATTRGAEHSRTVAARGRAAPADTPSREPNKDEALLLVPVGGGA